MLTIANEGANKYNLLKPLLTIVNIAMVFNHGLWFSTMVCGFQPWFANKVNHGQSLLKTSVKDQVSFWNHNYLSIEKNLIVFFFGSWFATMADQR